MRGLVVGKAWNYGRSSLEKRSLKPAVRTGALTHLLAVAAVPFEFEFALLKLVSYSPLAPSLTLKLGEG